MRYLLVVTAIIWVTSQAIGQTDSLNFEPFDSLTLPGVFLMGEYEEQYGLLYETYNEILLSVCNDDMDLAFNKWMYMLSEMEAYAESIDFDLLGVKIWLMVFWNENGQIDYLGYHLKPNSKQVDRPDMRAFLKSFSNRFEMPLRARVKYTHNGSAQFPTAIIPPVGRKND